MAPSLRCALRAPPAARCDAKALASGVDTRPAGGGQAPRLALPLRGGQEGKAQEGLRRLLVPNSGWEPDCLNNMSQEGWRRQPSDRVVGLRRGMGALVFPPLIQTRAERRCAQSAGRRRSRS